MPLFNRNKALVALSLGALAALGACGDDVTVPVAPAAPVVLTISPPSANMNIGEALNFAVQISGGSATAAPTLASCTSSNAAVATAAVQGSACRVTAVAAGNATVTAAASTGQSAAAAITVAPQAAAISGLAISPATASIPVNQTVTLVPTVNRANSAVAVTYTYTSSSNTIATVSAAGVVTAVAPGVATITVTATGTGAGAANATLTTAATITVTALPAGISAVSANPSALNLGAGRTAQIVASATQPTGAPAATFTYASSATSVATVSATGVVTAVAPGTAVITVTGASAANANFAAGSGSAAVTVTVTALPAGLTSLTVSPSSLTVAAGGTAQVTALAQGPTASAATVTYGTTAPGVATVSASGLVTGVAPGSATITATATSAATADFAASTLSSTVTVTVSPLAQVAIASITDNTGAAVNIASVTGNIVVNTNLITNGNPVSSVQLFSCPVGGDAAAIAACVAGTPVAQQTFGAAGAASGNIAFNVNTAAFRVASDFSSATVDFPNGQRNLVATATTTGTGSSANSNLAVLNFNNTDGWAARHTAPTNTATDANGNAWFGGPGAAGRGSVTIVPVIYTPNRTITSASVILGTVIAGVNTQAAGCTAGASTSTGTGTMTFTSASARPWTFTYGTSLGSGLNATNIVCSGESAAAATNVTPLITTATDNSNAAYTGGFLTSTTTATVVTLPAAIRGDWARPTAASATYTFQASSANQSVAAGSTWVGASYNFADGNGATTAGENFTATEGGVGLATTPLLEVSGCGSATFVALTTNTAADVAECPTDVSAAAYTIRYSPADRLGNAQVWTSATGTNPAPAGASATFGVDKTAPLIRWSASTRANGTLIGSVATLGTVADTVFSAEAIDDRAGLNTATLALMRANNTSAGARAGACVLGSFPTGATTAGSTFISAPNCSVNGAAGFAATALADGYRMVTTGRHTRADLNAAHGNGYFTQNVRVWDRAGNSATVGARNVMVNHTVGTVTVTDPSGVFNATSGITLAGSVAPTVESASFALQLQYGAVAFTSLRFPAVASGKTAFDDVALTATEAVSLTTPFTTGTTLYTSIEETNNPTNAVTVGGGNLSPLNNAGIIATTFTGNPALTYAGSGFTGAGTAITADNTVWNTKAPNIQTFAVVDSTAAFNSPAGGLKARVVTSAAQTASPFSRIDFYRIDGNLGGGANYLGSVNAQATPCTSGTCEVYYSDNGLSKSWTYVLRTAANDYTGAAQRWRGTAEVNALNAAVPAPATPFSATQIIAIATGLNPAVGPTASPTVAGRGLLSQTFTLP